MLNNNGIEFSNSIYSGDISCKRSMKIPKKCHAKNLMIEIRKTIVDLEESVKLSHNTERTIFQNELQQQIDNHSLEVELVKERTKNERLKRLNENSFHKLHYSHNKENRSEVKYLKNKCLDLTSLLKKRSNQLFKARAQIRDLKADNERLQAKLKARNTKLNDMITDYNDSISRMENEIERTKSEAEMQKQLFIQSDLNVALQQQIKRNNILFYNNCQLKSQIAYSQRVDKFNASTQISLDDILNSTSDEEISG